MATFCGSKCFEPLNLAHGGENDQKFSGVAKETESSCEEKPPKFISGEVPIRLIAPPVVPENEKNTNLLAEIAVNAPVLLTIGQVKFEFETKHFTDFSHGQPLARHRHLLLGDFYVEAQLTRLSGG